jgi:hypothetical protein
VTVDPQQVLGAGHRPCSAVEGDFHFGL